MRENIEILSNFSNRFEGIKNKKEMYQTKEEVLTDFLKAYYADMHEVEKLHVNDKYKDADKRYLIGLKTKIFKTYWHNHESYYLPCSISSAPYFLWNQIADLQVYEKGDDLHPVYLISIIYQENVRDSRVYLIEYKNGKLGIQHEFIKVF